MIRTFQIALQLKCGHRVVYLVDGEDMLPAAAARLSAALASNKSIIVQCKTSPAGATIVPTDEIACIDVCIVEQAKAADGGGPRA